MKSYKNQYKIESQTSEEINTSKYPDSILNENNYKCIICNKNAKYRCNMCKKYFLCENNIHIIDWDLHTKTCPALNRQKKYLNYTNLINYESLWQKQRKEIIELMIKKEYPLAIDKTYSLIKENYEKLNQYEKELKIIPFHDINAVKNNKNNIFNSFLYYEDYFCNLLLLIHIFSLFKSKEEIWRLLQRLIKEIEVYNFSEISSIFIEINNEKIKENKPIDNLNIEQEIYLRILKFIINIAKYGFMIGEFGFYEKYLLDYVQKIMEIYSNDLYIFYNLFLLLGNLYAEFGLLKKSHKFYEKIIEKNNLSNKDNNNLYEVVLCANYNSGLINFVIDKYEIAKQKLENAIQIKQNFLKEKNDKQISIIYETLCEIDIEFKNYSSAFINLQKALEARELSNTMDKEFEIKLNELREYIEQNSTDIKTDLNNNFYLDKIKNSDENENKKIILKLINDCPLNVSRIPDIKELEKFFLFMTKLSNEQIKKLNEDQPDDYEKNKYFPIVFSKNFKNSLTHNQRLNLCDLKLTSLTRINVLKNYMKKITIKNLNYNVLNLVPEENNLNSIRNMFITKNILKNWEIKDDNNVEEEKLNFKNDNNNSDKNFFDEDEKEKSFENTQEINFELNDINNNNNLNNLEKDEIEDNKSISKEINLLKKNDKNNFDSSFNEELDLLSNLSIKNTSNISEQKELNYSSLLHNIQQYCKIYCPEKKNLIDDKFIFLLCREGNLTNDDLLKIQNNPELIKLLLDTYSGLIQNPNEDNKKNYEKSENIKNDKSYDDDDKENKFINENVKLFDNDIINNFIVNENFDDGNKNSSIPPLPPGPIPGFP